MTHIVSHYELQIAEKMSCFTHNDLIIMIDRAYKE